MALNPSVDSMKRIIIICEGQTEQEFCHDVLYPHFLSLGIVIETPTIKKNKGGIVSWAALKYQIETTLKQDSTATVTTLIDFYGIHANHEFPQWQEVQGHNDKSQAMELMEKAMLQDIDPALSHRFLPYIQLHEFEALLFCDLGVLNNGFDKNDFKDYAYLKQTMEAYENPEDINNSSLTAPSKRLHRIFKSYNKVLHGPLITETIGLPKLRAKCPRFGAWISKLERV